MEKPDKTLAGVCGLFCPSCTVYVGTQEDPKRLEMLAARMQLTPEELSCNGCRSDKRCLYCERCTMSKCSADKGIDFCHECSDFPCEDLKTFQAQMPHRNELWKSHERMKEVGFEQWYNEMIEHYSCSQCHTINSAYDFVCRKCGASPGSPYVALHKEEIAAHLEKLKKMMP